MKIWIWVLSGVCLLLICWCNINIYFINDNTERIEKLEKYLPKNTIDTIYIINFENKKR